MSNCESWGPPAPRVTLPRTVRLSVTHEHGGIRLGVMSAGPTGRNGSGDDRIVGFVRDDRWDPGDPALAYFVLDDAGRWYAITLAVHDKLLNADRVRIERVRGALRFILGEARTVDVPYLWSIAASARPSGPG